MDLVDAAAVCRCLFIKVNEKLSSDASVIRQQMSHSLELFSPAGIDLNVEYVNRG